MISRAVAVSFLCGLVFVGTAESKPFKFQYQKIVPVDGPVQITVKNADGDVTITTNNEFKLQIDAVKTIEAENEKDAETIAEQIQIGVSPSGRHFTIEPKFETLRDRSPSFFKKLIGESGERSYGSVSFIISVPTDCSAEIFNTSGNIEVAGTRGRLTLAGTAGNATIRDMAGNVEVSTTSGAVSLKDIEGNIRINASGSEITFASLTGNLEVRNSSGSVTGEYLVGDLTVSQTTGAVDVREIDGDVRVKSSSGRVTVGQQQGALDITSESGDISIKTNLSSKKDFFVETVSGSIEFLIPGSAGGRVDLEAESGDIDTQIPISIDSFSKTRISGTFGAGGPKILLTTKSGEITLAEY